MSHMMHGGFPVFVQQAWNADDVEANFYSTKNNESELLS